MTMNPSANHLPVRFVCDKCGACFDTSLMLLNDRDAIELEYGSLSDVRLVYDPDPFSEGWSSWRFGGEDETVYHMCTECTMNVDAGKEGRA